MEVPDTEACGSTCGAPAGRICGPGGVSDLEAPGGGGITEAPSESADTEPHLDCGGGRCVVCSASG